MSKTLQRNLQAKMDTLQGSEWDSSDEEAEEKVVARRVSKITKSNKTPPSKQRNKSPKNEMNKEEAEKDDTVLYIGHLPSEFEEVDLKNFLQQFGNVLNIRISRSVRTGKSRGYAFVRWEDAETARVVADTLQGYFVGQRRLVCHAVPNPHKSMFYNTDKVMKRRQLKRKVTEKERECTLGNATKIKEITARLVQRERKKRAELKSLGIDYDFPGYEANQMNDDEDKVVDDITDVKEFTMCLDGKKEEPSQSDEKKKRKDSLDRVTSAFSSRNGSDSVGIESSATKKSKRKDCVGIAASGGSASSAGKRKSTTTISVDKALVDKTPTKSTKKEVHSEKKTGNVMKNKKRRESTH